MQIAAPTHKLSQTFGNIILMNFGFLGIQYSFGLQQTAVNPIYGYLGANPDQLPLLNLAGPITGLLVQPVIGAISDKTWSDKWGRRKPFFLIGALACSICLFIFPFSSSLWMAVGLLWLLDAANNTSLEPYRAFVADHLNEQQQPTGFLAQSFFTGLGITLANFSLYILQKFLPNSKASAYGIPYWVYVSFFIGGLISFSSVYFSTRRLKEYPPSAEEMAELKTAEKGLLYSLKDIGTALKNMPKIMWHLALVYLFQWYALFCYWQYVSLSIAKEYWHTTNAKSEAYNEALGWTGLLNGSYNIVAFISALALMYISKKVKPKIIHAVSLLLAGLGLLALPFYGETKLTLLSMVGMGIGWASCMAIPYLIVVPHIPKQKYGVYMGIINMMIVLPMFIQTVTFKPVFKNLLHANPSLSIVFAGVFLMIAATLTIVMRDKKPKML